MYKYQGSFHMALSTAVRTCFARRHNYAVSSVNVGIISLQRRNVGVDGRNLTEGSGPKRLKAYAFSKGGLYIGNASPTSQSTAMPCFVLCAGNVEISGFGNEIMTTRVRRRELLLRTNAKKEAGLSSSHSDIKIKRKTLDGKGERT